MFNKVYLSIAVQCPQLRLVNVILGPFNDRNLTGYLIWVPFLLKNDQLGTGT